MNGTINGKIYDLIGVGLGPFNLGLAALLDQTNLDCLFLEQKPEFQWHPGLLIENSTIQVPFLADLVTMADPCSPYSFLNYLHAQSRLYHFYFFEKFHIPRREYNHYCRWVSQQLNSCQFGQRVESLTLENIDFETYYKIESRELKTGKINTYFAHHLVLGVGSIPQVPPCFQNIYSDHIFHSAEFLNRRDRALQSDSITVIGSGQSAAEVFYELLQQQSNYSYRLEWHTRSAGFLPMEYSKLGLEHFSPDYIDYFYHLPPQKRDRLLSEQGLLYKGISFETIADIYDLLYERSIGGQPLNVRLLPLVEVKEVERVTTEKGDRFVLGYRHSQQETRFTHETDCVILATGYRHAIPRCIDGIRDLIQWDSRGRYEVKFDYRLALNREISNHIFVQNGELHTHGIGAPDLGLGAHRNSVIINTLLGETVYPVERRNVFQQFGVA
jgi:lysine N6-hydroxylase